MSDFFRRARFRAAVFVRDRGATASADWVVLTALAIVAGLATLSFILGPQGGVAGLVEALTREMDQLGDNMAGTAANGAGAGPGADQRVVSPPATVDSLASAGG